MTPSAGWFELSSINSHCLLVLKTNAYMIALCVSMQLHHNVHTVSKVAAVSVAYLWLMVVQSFKQHLVLLRQVADWQAISVAQALMWHRPSTAELAVGVNNYHPLLELVCHCARNIPQEVGLPCMQALICSKGQVDCHLVLR